MAVRRRLRSIVHRLAMGTLNIALEGLEDLENTVQGWFEDPPVDDEEDLALDPYADELDDDLGDEELIEDTEAYLDAVEEIEGDIAELEMELDVELGESGTVLPFPVTPGEETSVWSKTQILSPRLDGKRKSITQVGIPPEPRNGRPLAVPFLDAETGSPILQLRGKKNKFGSTRHVVISNDKIPAWAKLKMVGIQVTVHGWQSDEEAQAIPEGKQRIYVFREEAFGKGYEGVDSNVTIKLVDVDCSRATIAKILAEAFEMDAGDITDWHIRQAKNGPPKKDKTMSPVPLYAKSLRVDDGGNLLPQKGWNPLMLDIDAPLGLRDYPMLEHVEDGDRVAMKIALGPLGQKRTDSLFCSVSLLVAIEADSVLGMAGAVTGR